MTKKIDFLVIAIAVMNSDRDSHQTDIIYNPKQLGLKYSNGYCTED
ncbi:hypothetical protein [Myxosarcina sp. GI1]|nr:hypothetical protein [Myxosarcina sp. GI1]